MTFESAVASFAVVALLVTLTPGLDTALVLRTAAVQGRSRAAAAALGINAGVLVWGVAAAIGVSAIITASEVAFAVLKYVGAAYMLWLGGRLVVRALRGNEHATVDDLPPVDATHGALFRQGLVVNLLNPKIGAFYVAVLPQFMPTDVPAVVSGVALALVHNLEGLVWFAVLIVAADRMRRWLSSPRAHRWIDGISGTAIAGFGIKLALSKA